MNTSTTHIRKPVRRDNAQHYLLLTLLSFSTTVVVTRLFLTLTGFPKIGRGELHIAHLLWGGLLLFIAMLLLTILENRWVYTLGALLGGIGVGLFIDEVGKFITTNNDYFYPLAIPIIYVFFLIIVLLYLGIRRPESQDARAELYRALEIFQELLDRNMKAHDRKALDKRLQNVIDNTETPDLKRLAQTLRDFLSTEDVQLSPGTPTAWEWLIHKAQAFESKYTGPQRLKVILIAGLGIVGMLALTELISVLWAVRSPAYLEDLARHWIQTDEIKTLAGLNWVFIRLTLEGTIGLLLVVAGVLLAIGHDHRGIELGYLGLLLSLTMVNLVLFYFDQFGNIFLTLTEFVLLVTLLHYRWLYIHHPAISEPLTTPQQVSA